MAITSFPVRWFAPSSRSTAAGSSERSWSSQARSSRSIMASSRRSRRRRGQGSGVGSGRPNRVARACGTAPNGWGKHRTTEPGARGTRHTQRRKRPWRARDFSLHRGRRASCRPPAQRPKFRSPRCQRTAEDFFAAGGAYARRPQWSWRPPLATDRRAWRRNAPGVTCATRRNARANETVES
jgi:hypothetical protein